MSSPISNQFVRTSRLHRTATGQLLRDVGLHPGQELLMMQLWEHGSQRQCELSKALGVDASTLTRMVQRLEHAGFVRRNRCAKDRRVWEVESTTAGQALRDRVLATWSELEKISVDGLSADEITALSSALQRIEGNLCEFVRRAGQAEGC